MSVGEYIWASDVRKAPQKILNFFERQNSTLGEIEKFHIDISCFDFKPKKEYAIYIYPDRVKKKGGMETLSTGDNMVLKLGDDGKSAPGIANQIYDILKGKYKCCGDNTVVDATDKRRYYHNMKRTPMTYPLVIE